MPSKKQQLALNSDNEYSLQSSFIPTTHQTVEIFDSDKKIATLVRDETGVRIDSHTEKQINIFGDVKCKKFEVKAKGNLCLDLKTTCEQISYDASSLVSFQPIDCHRLHVNVKDAASFHEGKITVQEQFTLKAKQFEQNAEITVHGTSSIEADLIESRQHLSLHNAALTNVKEWRFHDACNYLLNATTSEQAHIQQCHIKKDANVILTGGSFHFNEFDCVGHVNLDETEIQCARQFSVNDKATLRASNSHLNANSLDLQGTTTLEYSSVTSRHDLTLFMGSQISGEPITAISARDHLRCDGLVRYGKELHFSVGQNLSVNNTFMVSSDVEHEIQVGGDFHLAAGAKAEIEVNCNMRVEGDANIHGHLSQSGKYSIKVGKTFSTVSYATATFKNSEVEAKTIEHHGSLDLTDTHLRVKEKLTASRDSKITGNKLSVEAETAELDADVTLENFQLRGDTFRNTGHLNATQCEIRCNNRSTNQGTITSDYVEVVAPLWSNRGTVTVNKKYTTHTLVEETGSLTLRGSMDRHSLFTFGSKHLLSLPNPVKMITDLLQNPTQLFSFAKNIAERYTKNEDLIYTASLVMALTILIRDLIANKDKIAESYQRHFENNEKTDQSFISKLMDYLFNLPRNEYISLLWELKRLHEEITGIFKMAPTQFKQSESSPLEYLKSFLPQHHEESLVSFETGVSLTGNQSSTHLFKADNSLDASVYKRQTAQYRLLQGISAAVESVYEGNTLINNGEIDSSHRSEMKYETVHHVDATVNMRGGQMSGKKMTAQNSRLNTEDMALSYESVLLDAETKSHLKKTQVNAQTFNNAGDISGTDTTLTTHDLNNSGKAQLLGESSVATQNTLNNSGTLNVPSLETNGKSAVNTGVVETIVTTGKVESFSNEGSFSTASTNIQTISWENKGNFNSAGNTVIKTEALNLASNSTTELHNGTVDAQTANTNGTLLGSDIKLSADNLNNAGKMELSEESSVTTQNTFSNNGTVIVPSLETNGKSAVNTGVVETMVTTGKVESFSNEGSFSTASTNIQTISWENKGNFNSAGNTVIKTEALNLASNSTTELHNGTVDAQTANTNGTLLGSDIQLSADNLNNAGKMELSEESSVTTQNTFNNSKTLIVPSLETNGKSAVNAGVVEAVVTTGKVECFSNEGSFSTALADMQNTSWENKGEFHSTECTAIRAEKLTLAPGSTTEITNGVVGGRTLIAGEKSEALMESVDQQQASGKKAYTPAEEHLNNPTTLIADNSKFLFEEEIFFSPDVTMDSYGETLLKSNEVIDFSTTNIEGEHTVDAKSAYHYGKFTGNSLNYTARTTEFFGSSDISSIELTSEFKETFSENRNYGVSEDMTINNTGSLRKDALWRDKTNSTFRGVTRIDSALQSTADLSISSERNLDLYHPISARNLTAQSNLDINNHASHSASESMEFNAGRKFTHAGGNYNAPKARIDCDSFQVDNDLTGNRTLNIHTRNGNATIVAPVGASEHIGITQAKKEAHLDVLSTGSFAETKPTKFPPPVNQPGRVYVFTNHPSAKNKAERKQIWIRIVVNEKYCVEYQVSREISNDQFNSASKNKHFSPTSFLAQRVNQMVSHIMGSNRGSVHGGDGANHNGVGLALDVGHVTLQGASLEAEGDIRGTVSSLTARPNTTQSSRTKVESGKSALQKVLHMRRVTHKTSEHVDGASIRSKTGSIDLHATGDIVGKSLTVEAPGNKSLTADGKITMESTVTQQTTKRVQPGNPGKDRYSKREVSTPTQLLGGGETRLHAAGPVTLPGIRVEGPENNKGNFYCYSDTSVKLNRTKLSNKVKQRFLELGVFINGFEVSKPLMALFNHSHISKQQWLDKWRELIAHEPMVKQISDCMHSENIYEALAKSWNAGVEGLEALNALATCINTESSEALLKRTGFDSLEITTEITERVRTRHEETLANNEGIDQENVYFEAPEIHFEGGIACHADNTLGLSATTVSCSPSELDWRDVKTNYSLSLGTDMAGHLRVGVGFERHSVHGTRVVAPTLTAGRTLSYKVGKLSGTVICSAPVHRGNIDELSLQSVPDKEKSSGQQGSLNTSGEVSVFRGSGRGRTIAGGAAGLVGADASDLTIGNAKLEGSALELPNANIGQVTGRRLRHLGQRYSGFGFSTNAREMRNHFSNKTKPESEAGNLFVKGMVKARLETIREEQTPVVTGAKIETPVAGHVRTKDNKGLKKKKERSFNADVMLPFTNAEKLRTARDNFQTASEKIMNFLLPAKELSYLEKVHLLSEIKRNMEAEVSKLTDNSHNPSPEETVEATRKIDEQENHPLKKPTTGDLIAKGLEDSSLNLRVRSTPTTDLDMSKLGALDRLTYNLSSLAGDMPVIIATGEAVKFFTRMFARSPLGMVITLGGGATIFAAPALIRESRDAWKKYKETHPGTSFSFNEFLKEHAKDILKETGDAALLGALTTMAGMVGVKYTAPAARPLNVLTPDLTKIQAGAKVASEAAAMVAVPPALNGELPTGSSALDVGLLIGVTHAGIEGGRVLKNRAAFNRNQAAYYPLPAEKSIAGESKPVYALHFEGSVPVYADCENALKQAKTPIEVAFNGENHLATDCLLNTAESAKNGDSFLLFEDVATINEGPHKFNKLGVEAETKVTAVAGREPGTSGKRFVLVGAKNPDTVYLNLVHEGQHNGHANTFGDTSNPYFPENREAPEQWNRARQADKESRFYNGAPSTKNEKFCNALVNAPETSYMQATRDAESAAFIAESSAVDDAYTRKIAPEQVKLLEESLVNVRENTRLAPVKHMLEKILPSLTETQQKTVSTILTHQLAEKGMQGNLFDNQQSMRSSYTFRHQVIREIQKNKIAILDAIRTQNSASLESTCKKMAETVYQKVTEANNPVPLRIPFTPKNSSSTEEEKPDVTLPFTNAGKLRTARYNFQTASEKIMNFLLPAKELSYLEKVHLLSEIKRNMEAEVSKLTDNSHNPSPEETVEATRTIDEQENHPLKKPPTGDLIAKGLEDSSLNLRVRSTPTTDLDMSKLGTLDRLTYNLFNLAGDMPVIIATGEAVKFFTRMFARSPLGMVITLGGGATIFAAPALIRESRDAWKKYKETHPDTSFSFNEFLKEHAKDILKETGDAALLGALTTMAGMVGVKYTAPAARPLNVLTPDLTKIQAGAKVASEAAAMVAVPPALKSELPKGPDALDVALLIGVTHAGIEGGRVLKNRVDFNRNQAAYYPLPQNISFEKSNRVYTLGFYQNIPIYADSPEALKTGKIIMEEWLNEDHPARRALCKPSFQNVIEGAKTGKNIIAFQNTETVEPGKKIGGWTSKHEGRNGTIDYMEVAVEDLMQGVYSSFHEAQHVGLENTFGNEHKPYFRDDHESAVRLGMARIFDELNRPEVPPPADNLTSAECDFSIDAVNQYDPAVLDQELLPFLAEAYRVDPTRAQEVVPKQIEFLKSIQPEINANTTHRPITHMLKQILPSLTETQQKTVSTILTHQLTEKGMQGNLFDNQQSMPSSYTFRHQVIREIRKNQTAILDAIRTQDSASLESTCKKMAEAVYQKVTEANDPVPLHIPFTSEDKPEEEKPGVVLSKSRDSLYGRHSPGQATGNPVSNETAAHNACHPEERSLRQRIPQ